MSEITQHDTNFVGYEYKDMLVRRSMESVFADGYGNFGWTLDSVSSSIPSHSSVIMKFKRDRKIRNKNELTRLQRQFESCVAEIERLEKSKVIGAGVVAYTLGVSGTACMASTAWLKFVSGCGILSGAGTHPLYPVLHRKRVSYGRSTTASSHRFTAPASAPRRAGSPDFLSPSFGAPRADRAGCGQRAPQRRARPGARL